MQTNPGVEQSKIIRWSKSPWKQSGRKGKGLWRKGFAEEPTLEFSQVLSHPPVGPDLRYFERFFEVAR